MEGLSDLENTPPRSNSVVLRELDQMLGELDRPAEQHPSRPRSNSVINAEIEQMIAELRTREEEHHARVEEIRHSMPFFEADADLFRRAGILGSREAVRLQSMSRNALARDPDSGPLTPAGKRFMEQLPVVDEKDFPDETSCGTCMESYGSTDEPESRARLPCGHLMGRRCIERWLETSNTCPLCRHVLYEEDAESPAFLELQEILQRLGPAVTTLFLRMGDHVTYSGTSGGTPTTEYDIDSMWREVAEIRPLQAALEVRVAAYNSDAADGLLGPESDAELEQLRALDRELADRYKDLFDNYEEIMNSPSWVRRVVLGPERAHELWQLNRNAMNISFDLTIFRRRREEMLEMHGDSISDNE